MTHPLSSEFVRVVKRAATAKDPSPRLRRVLKDAVELKLPSPAGALALLVVYAELAVLG
jgi:hypothetical protein